MLSFKNVSESTTKSRWEDLAKAVMALIEHAEKWIVKDLPTTRVCIRECLRESLFEYSLTENIDLPLGNLAAFPVVRVASGSNWRWCGPAVLGMVLLLSRTERAVNYSVNSAVHGFAMHDVGFTAAMFLFIWHHDDSVRRVTFRKIA